METKIKNLPAWLETLYNVNPTLAERAEQYLNNKPNKIKSIKEDLSRQIENIEFVRINSSGREKSDYTYYSEGYNDALDFCKKQLENSIYFVEQIYKTNNYD